MIGNKSFGAAAALLLATVTGGVAGAQEITGFTHAGEGCPGGQALWSYNPATRMLRLTTPSLAVDAESNPSTSCNIDLVVRSAQPAVHRFASVTYFGHIDKAEGATAQLRRRYQADVGATESEVKTWDGQSAARGLFLVQDEDVARSSCSREATLGLTTRLTVSGATPSKVSMVSDSVPSIYISLDAQPCD
jgi:hypothetical protein